MLSENQSDAAGVDRVKDLVSQLYTTMNLTEWQANKESELIRSVEKIRHELEPYEKVSAAVLTVTGSRCQGHWTQEVETPHLIRDTKNENSM